ncbi:competence protein CoiA [Virgibacillus sp. DJP39]|uniref:competence protein CoiA n=1 Tax=Virgibacillus sp. DJP39 TaxID=3409790 RepID=UPI003BB7BFE7
MLQAKSNSGKLTTLVRLTKQELLEAKNDIFYCPTCNEQVLIKAGPKTIPHFAHYAKAECAANDHGEGPYHEQGKLLLYEWLTNQRIETELEKYIPELGQRPDILVTLNSRRKIAIEYQCARIPTEILNQRNIGYRGAGITPIWILGAKHFHRLRHHHFKIDQFILSFLHRFSPEFPLTLFFFCPHTQQFIIIQHIYLITSRHAIGRFKFNAAKDLSFPKMFTKQTFPVEKLFELWKNEKTAFRLQQSNRVYGSELAWKKWLYEKGGHRETLSSVVYLPVQGQYRMKTSLGNWQSRLIIEVLEPLPIGATFTLDRCYQILRYRPQQQSILVTGEDDPVYHYLKLLKQLKLIDEVQLHSFKKLQNITFPKYIENSLLEDASLMNRLMQCSTIE